MPGVGTRDPHHGLGMSSTPLTRGRFSEAIGHTPLPAVHESKVQAICTYVEALFPSPYLIGPLFKYKEKVLRDPGPNTQTAATIHKEVLTTHPHPHPHPSKKGVPKCGGGGGYGGQNPKNHWGIIFGLKMMILQGVRHPKPYNGICYANDPKKGGVYDAHACA